MTRGTLGRLGTLVIAGVVTSAVVAAIAIGASSGSQAGASAKANTPPVGSLQLGSGPATPMLAYSWGVSNSGTTHGGSGGGAGKANVQDISLTRFTDPTSVDLLKNVTTGLRYPSAVVIATSSGTGTTMKYELTNVMVTAVSLGGTGGEKQLTENVTLNFAKVKWTFTDAAGNTTFGEYDIAANSTS